MYYENIKTGQKAKLVSVDEHYKTVLLLLYDSSKHLSMTTVTFKKEWRELKDGKN